MSRQSLPCTPSTATVHTWGASERDARHEFRDWAAYTASDGNGQVCVAMSKPTDVSPAVDG